MKTSLSYTPLEILKRLACACGLLLGTVAVHAELTFKRTVIEDVIAPGVKSYPFEFAFENTGESAVQISEIKTTCGCTTAKLEKMRYAPGESGVIQGSFSVGSRQGLQQKSITVMTEDLGQPAIKLNLSLEIPQLATIKPGLLLWRVASEVEAKSFRLVPNASLGVRVVSIEADGDSFTVHAIPREDGSYLVEVSPTSLEAPTRALVKIQLATAGSPSKPSSLYAHAIVR